MDEPDDTVPTPAGTCTEPSCTVTADGPCAKGHDPIDCDSFELTPPSDGDPVEHAPKTDGRLPLPSGEALRPVELRTVLSRHPTARTVPLGGVDAGKTTLFAVLFEMLTADRLPTWTYSGSSTTLGFARRSHLAAMRSKRKHATTGRTSRLSGDRALHFNARRRTDDEFHSVLLADVSGEHVDELTASGLREPVLVDALADAHHLPIVIDGALAAAPRTREQAIRNAVDLIHLLPTLDLRDDARICIVLTKLDHFGEGHADTVIERVQDAADRSLDFVPEAFQVAARPDRGSGTEPGLGLDDLLNHLVQIPEGRSSSPSPAVPPALDARMLRDLWAGSR